MHLQGIAFIILYGIFIVLNYIVFLGAGIFLLPLRLGLSRFVVFSLLFSVVLEMVLSG